MNLPTSAACHDVPHARIVTRSTARELRFGDLHLLEEDLAGVLRDAAEDRLARGGRLLEDLLEHEVLVAGLLRHDRIPQHALRRLGDRPAEEVGERRRRCAVMTAISSSPRNTTSRVWLRIAGMSDATKNSPSPRPTTIGGPLRTVTIFSGSSAEISTSANRPRISSSARRTAFSRPSSFISRSTRCATISVSVSVTNLWPCALQLLLQIEVVLDDAVVDDDDLAGAVAVRMGVLLGRPAVRRPARVADAVVAGDRIERDDVLEVRQLAGAAAQVDRAVAHHRHARRVVAAIFEPPQPLDQDRDDVLGSDVSDDPAHSCLIL